MTFTKEPPKTPGDFAWKQDASDEEYILAQVRLVDGVLLDESSDAPPSDVGGVWCRLVPAEDLEASFLEGYRAGIRSGSISSFIGDLAKSESHRVVEGGTWNT